MSVRVTIRGAHEGLVEPLVVTDGGAGVNQHDGVGRRPHVLLLELPSSDASAPARHELVVDGWRFEVEIEPERRAALRERARRAAEASGHSGPAEVRAIIPGVVVSVAVAPGDAVAAGQQLLVVEAMKMQNELPAPRAGVVTRVEVGERSTIDIGDLLVVIE